MGSPTIDAVTAVVTRIGNIQNVAADQDIFEAGMNSVDALQLLLELEATFNVSIPDAEFVSSRTPRALADLIGRLAEDT